MHTKINRADLERENQSLRQELAELDELPSQKKRAGEGLSKLKGVQDIATVIGKKIHAAPPGQGNHDYLDLYLLHKERERLAKETASLKKRRQQLGVKVTHIDREVAKIQESVRADVALLPAESQGKPTGLGSQQQVVPEKYEYKEEKWHRLTLGY